MNCTTHCALCGRDLWAKFEYEARAWEAYRMFSHEHFKDSRLYIDPSKRPPPVQVDEDRWPVCDCTEETSLARRRAL